MAIGSPSSMQHAAPTPSASHTGIDIDAWTISALQSLSVSPIARGTGSPLSIPIDELVLHRPRAATASKTTGAARAVQFDADELAAAAPRRPPSRRDSMARREPTHPIHVVPYQVAQYWDRGVRERVGEQTRRLQAARKKQQLLSGNATGLGVGEVPRDLRESAKRSPAVRGWVRALEEPVRRFVHEHLSSGSSAEEDEDEEEALGSDEEEIVFAGRADAMRELREKKTRAARRDTRHGVVFDELGDDESAAFKRWLTHSISDYYGLASRSVPVGGSSQKVVYVGLKQAQQMAPTLSTMPRPLWELC
ncbi:hypothetical protein MY5147_000727 [Beauveria neobassiana]